MQPRDRVFQTAGEIIRRAGRDNPADAVLRDELKKRGGITPGDSRRIAGLVFDYYRWHGWLDATVPMAERLRAAVELRDQFTEEPAAFADEEILAKAIPDWVAQVMDVSPAWARSLQSKPKLWLRARPGQGGTLAAKLKDCVPFGEGVMADTLEYRGTRDLFGTEEFHRGEFELQDISSQIVGLLCDAQPGQCWWDVCAGSGGKTLHLSDLMRNKGLIWASDRAEWRLTRLKRRAARAHVFNYRVASWDGRDRLPTATMFDGVLLDAPCSGIGTWQRNPHARWTTNPEDVRELAAKQLGLLRCAASAVKPGGRLIYAVCTLTKAESDETADAFSRAHPDFEPAPITNPAQADSRPSARLPLRAEEWGGNGMFVAVWRRNP